MRKKILWFVALTVVVSLTAVSGLASAAVAGDLGSQVKGLVGGVAHAVTDDAR